MEDTKDIKILVVEDESIIALNIKKKLKSFGYTVPALATTGEEAIKMAEITFPDLILMDVRLKGEMDGIRTAEEIRKDFDIPIVYLTAYSDDEILEKAKKTKPYGYIVKPFKANDLRSNIEMALYRHEMEKSDQETVCNGNT
ncbi:MAG: two-component system, response regulator PdtaR [Methanolobus sp.]|uniref:CheY-like receiver domain-containing protein n=1 Tax=Methanolobus tindarius DSM 2278 TaxID=1090322 RepID=W9DPB6_METTI|nr:MULTISPECIES: response regulator [Methanolobus]ETA68099.1 CheY-like receiver domain-containing protein [Methanolobus tindarius DSM 2278]MDI3486962.1 two-component system, response regulator PdtaR [Methanolobus sp.]MDK2832645.1 two-component system, response regulator PdtaR [Methanolobus sp.]MDK2940217.1 two-component system, response regulator PdtaR [Methanolobus sp.]